MSQIDLDQLLQTAMARHKSGALDQARDLYRQILVQQPTHVGALHYLGVVEHQMGRNDAAVELIRQAIALKPDYPQAHNNLATILREIGQLEDASVACRQAIALKPDYPEPYNTLGNVLRDMGQLSQAAAEYRQAIALSPNYPEFHNNLGNALRETGDLENAIAACQRAIALRGDYAQAYCNLGNALRDLRQLDDAVAAYERAIELSPQLPEAFNNLGNARRDQGRLDEAIAHYQKAIQLRGAYAEAHSNLGNALKDTGRLDEAMAAYRQAMALKPNESSAHSNLIYTMHFHRGSTGAMIRQECRAWDRQHARPLRDLVQEHDNDRSPDRPLRVGFISPDFRDHVVGRNMLPLLAAHDRRQFQIACYGLLRRHDAMTTQFQALADIWRDVAADGDERIAQIIRDDKIDILIDLTLHMEGNRLLVLARKPAPVQVTFGGYPGTTGLETIDYRLTDPHLDPPGTDEFYSEESIRLPDCFWCYDPKQSDVAVNELPALGGGGITFGCLNNFCKVNESVLAAWSAILRDRPDSRMIILAGAGKHRDRTVAALGVEPDRVEFVEHCPREQYLKLHHRIDIVLDTFPYNGHTTSCDALWMGVPVVSLIGQTAVGRGGLSILSNINLAGLAATTPQHYIRIATELATDLSRLSALRAGLRGGMLASPLTDAKRFAANIESTYRQMWRRWCEI